MSTMGKVKAAIAATVVGALLLFILQNRELVTLRFLFWEFETRRAFLLLVVFASGLVIGWIVATITQLSARSHETSAHPVEKGSG